MESKNSYGFDSIISLIEEWSPPQPPKRTCPCGRTMSMYNPHSWCYACTRMIEKEMDDTNANKATSRQAKR